MIGINRKDIRAVLFYFHNHKSQILHKKISTHLLTVLTKHVILHAEQRKRKKRNPKIPLK